MRKCIWISCLLIGSAWAPARSQPGNAIADAHLHYMLLRGDCPPQDLFAVGYTGYAHLLQAGSLRAGSLLILADFRRHSAQKRLWVVDLVQDTVLFHTWVAHGKNSGEEWATRFSNTHGSLQSSLGFYRTAEPYEGKHGYSLRLDGLDTGFNDHARVRDIVLHSAAYASPGFIRQYGYCGRSWGCPAIPQAGHEELIGCIASGHCLLIYYPDADWHSRSRWLLH
ncbi:MAG: murein L,D-transpeptidase catalytic domain family protein [Bacteroidetes bacterium]|nr:murein L,D-transpeptidase catalytic domain family protein [Bacteroidota bacterium]